MSCVAFGAFSIFCSSSVSSLIWTGRKFLQFASSALGSSLHRSNMLLRMMYDDSRRSLLWWVIESWIDLKTWRRFMSWMTSYSLVLKASIMTSIQKCAHFEFLDLNRFNSSGYRQLAPWSLLNMPIRIFKVMSLKLGLFVWTFSSKKLWVAWVTAFISLANLT